MLEVAVPLPAPGEEPLLVDALRSAGAVEARRDGTRYLALFPDPGGPGDHEALTRRVDAAIRAAPSLAGARIAWRTAGDAGWSDRWAREFVARQVTPRIRIARATDPPASSGVTVRLEPGLGFGTASHPSTRAALRLLDPRVRPGDRVADVGAGSGILGIAAALLGAGRVVAFEPDASALASLRRNLAANDVAGRFRVRGRAVGPRGLAALQRFDVVVANIEAERLMPLVPGLERSVARDGWLVLGGATGRDRGRVVAAARRLDLREEAEDEGWWAAAFRATGASRGG